MKNVQTSSSKVEIDSKSMTSTEFRLTNGTALQISPFVHHGQPLLRHHNNNTRRKLGDFRECSPCTCCDSTRRWCLPTVCCYDINCGVQGLPFGLCSFTPISCTCLGCRDWLIDWLIRQPALHCFRVRISQSAAMWLKSVCVYEARRRRRSGGYGGCKTFKVS